MIVDRAGLFAALLVLVAAAPNHANAQDRHALTFCAGTDNLPMSQQGKPSGFEIDFARALAAELSMQLRITWLDPAATSFEQAVLDRECDAALGAIVDPGPMAGERLLSGVALTRPYYRAGYMLVRRAATVSPTSPADVGDARVAVERESIAVYTLRQQVEQVHVMPDFNAVIAAVAEARVPYGYVWAPVAAWALRDRTDVVLDARFDTPDAWDFALAVREDNPLRSRIDDSIQALVTRGEVAAIFHRYGVPYQAPGVERTSRPAGISR